MTTGEKLALLRKKSGMTQEELSERLEVSRQSVSRWEMNAAFPETEKLIKLSKIFGASIDYLLREEVLESREIITGISADDCCKFLRDCGYFFLATSVGGQPKLRPFGMIYSQGNVLFFATDKRKSVYSELRANPQIAIASYHLHTRKWLRILGKAEAESSALIKEELKNTYPLLKQKYPQDTEMFLAVFKLLAENIRMT